MLNEEQLKLVKKAIRKKRREKFLYILLFLCTFVCNYIAITEILNDRPIHIVISWFLLAIVFSRIHKNVGISLKEDIYIYTEDNSEDSDNESD